MTVSSVEKLFIFILATGMVLSMIAPAAQAQYDYAQCVVSGTVTVNGQPATEAVVKAFLPNSTQETNTAGGFYFFLLPVGQTVTITAYANDSSASRGPFQTTNSQPRVDLNIVADEPTPTPTSTATPTPTPTPNPNATATPTPTPTPSPTPTPTPNPNATATPTPTTTPTPTATPTPTSTPTPTATPAPASQPPTYYGPVSPTPQPTPQTDLAKVNATSPPVHRNVFSFPEWSGDHESITVTNNGDKPITVKAWVDSPSNNVSIPVGAGVTTTISTASILTQPNQILTVGFDAYEDDSPIDSYRITLTLGPTPTPLPEATTTRSPGFTVLIALAGILSVAYLTIKRRKR